jgi:hypothetical protein
MIDVVSASVAIPLVAPTDFATTCFFAFVVSS